MIPAQTVGALAGAMASLAVPWLILRISRGSMSEFPRDVQIR